jgi:hypothetical protein
MNIQIGVQRPANIPGQWHFTVAAVFALTYNQPSRALPDMYIAYLQRQQLAYPDPSSHQKLHNSDVSLIRISMGYS